MKKHITEKDYIKANRMASREEEIRLHGKQITHHNVWQSKKQYNRKRDKAGLSDLPYFCNVSLQYI